QNQADHRKYFVLDTNVLLHNPEALFMFDDNHVVIPFEVVEELDKFKKNNDDTGRNSRQVIRHLDQLRLKGRISEGVVWNGHGGTIQIDLGEHIPPPALSYDAPDNRIIGVAWQRSKDGQRVIFISKDINARIKSDALGITTEDFEAQKVDADRLYPGYTELEVDTATINQLYDQKQLDIETLLPFFADREANAGPAPARSYGKASEILLEANQFVLLRDRLDASHTGLGRRCGDSDEIVPVIGPRKTVFGIIARNVQQTMALDLLLDDQVKLITLLGMAGSGKTLLAVAAGLAQVVNEQRYDRLLVARPIMPLGRDIGYLPGDVGEKLHAWMQPIFDNLSYLLSTRGAGAQHAESKSPEQRMKALLDTGQILLEPLTYIRGRSIPNQFMIVDEAQNLTPHEVKTIASRVGEGTKLVLTGDIQQIDNPYLDSSSNGLSYMVEALKGSGIVGHVMLCKSERSDLASLVTEKL
ncbi:MAG: PhoH family protein, partial [Phycisphaeraceae bacterium]